MSDTISEKNRFKEIADDVIEIFEYIQDKTGLCDDDRIIELVKVIVHAEVDNPREIYNRSGYLDSLPDTWYKNP